MSTVFSVEDFDENLEGQDLPIGGQGAGGDDADGTGGVADKQKTPAASPSLTDLKLPDDFEIEEFRGLSVADALKTYGTQKDMMKQLLQNTTASATAAAAAATAASAAVHRNTPQPEPEDLEIKPEDLVGDATELNNKINRLIAAKTAPMAVEALQSLSQQAYAIAKSDKANMPYFDDYENEILALAGQQRVDATAKLSTWHGLYRQVIATKTPEIVEKEIKRRTEEAANANRPTPPSAERGRGGPAKGGKRTLDEDQMRVVRGLGITPEDYLANLPE